MSEQTEENMIDVRVTNIIENLPFIQGAILKQDIQNVLDSYHELRAESRTMRERIKELEASLRSRPYG